MKRKNKGNKTIIIIGTCILIAILSVGYAAFNSDLNISGSANIAKKTGAEMLKEMVVDVGDGLYIDPVEENRYVYKGANPNNYITFNNEEWRIISIEPDNTIKIIRNESIGDMPVDPGYLTVISEITSANSVTGTRYSSNSNNYCYESNASAYYGCTAWGSSSTMLNELGQPITSMPREIGGALYNLPATEAYINTYLNNEYYNNLANKAKGQIATKLWNVGVLKLQDGQTLATDIEQESTYKWSGKIALMNATDYVRSNTNTDLCGNVYANTWLIENYKECRTTTWLYKNEYYQWTVSPYSAPGGYSEWVVRNDSALRDHGVDRSNYHIRPVLHLKSDIYLSGNGIHGLGAYKIS